MWGGGVVGVGASHPALLGYVQRSVPVQRSVSVSRGRGAVAVYLMVVLLLLLLLMVVMLLVCKEDCCQRRIWC